MTDKRTPLVAGNWKMNGAPDMAKALVKDLAGKYKALGATKPFDMLVCPPFTLLALAYENAKDSGLLVGGQDCSALENGAHTGDISALMLKDMGAEFVILGHSERRADHRESSVLVREKAEIALKTGLKVIICVGETEEQQEAGETLKVIEEQIKESLPMVAKAENTVIAYEPVWAIGTGKIPTSEDIEKVHTFIRETLAGKIGLDESDKMRILYGGSVKPANASQILRINNVDGALVGGASLKAEDFWAIAEPYMVKE